jgi:large subunit ribosomal protein L36e
MIRYTDTRVGLNKGRSLTAIPKVARPSHRIGKLSERNKFVRSVVREVVGFSPYERRVLELLRNGKARDYSQL